MDTSDSAAKIWLIGRNSGFNFVEHNVCLESVGNQLLHSCLKDTSEFSINFSMIFNIVIGVDVCLWLASDVLKITVMSAYGLKQK